MTIEISRDVSVGGLGVTGANSLQKSAGVMIWFEGRSFYFQVARLTPRPSAPHPHVSLLCSGADSALGGSMVE